MLISPNRKKYLLATDLDGTLIGDKTSLPEFNRLLSHNRFAFLLIYVTGRIFSSAWQLLNDENLLLPDVLITDVGTEIYIAPSYEQDRDWADILSISWDPVTVSAIVESIEALIRQPIFPKFRLSYFVDNSFFYEAVLLLQNLVRKANLPVQVIPSMGCIVDIIPQRAGKGEALNYVRDLCGVDRKDVFVCGDSGNDLSMFSQGFKGILVGNARDELKNALKRHKEVYFSKERYASGILEGLRYYGLIL